MPRHAAASAAALAAGLTRASCRVPRAEGAIDAKTIAQHQLVDNHYYAIASKARAPAAHPPPLPPARHLSRLLRLRTFWRPPRAAPRACHGVASLALALALALALTVAAAPCAWQASLLKPVELQPAADKMADFAAKFGPSWSQALAEGLVHNAVDACHVLGVDAAALNEQWAAAKEAGQLFKFGGGFYVGRLSAGTTAMVTKSSDLLADLPKSLYGGFDALALSNGLDDSEKVRAARPQKPNKGQEGINIYIVFSPRRDNSKGNIIHI